MWHVCTYSQPWHYIQLSGDLHYPPAVLPVKGLLLPTEQQAVWHQNSSRRLGEGNNALHLPEVEPLFVSRPDCNLLIILNTLPWFHLRCLCDPNLLPSLLAVPLYVSSQTRFCWNRRQFSCLYILVYLHV